MYQQTLEMLLKKYGDLSYSESTTTPGKRTKLRNGLWNEKTGVRSQRSPRLNFPLAPLRKEMSKRSEKKWCLWPGKGVYMEKIMSDPDLKSDITHPKDKNHVHPVRKVLAVGG